MRSEGDTAAVAPAGAVSRRDGWAVLALAALFVVMLAATWQRWTHPIKDHGRELNLPARILAGEQLYRDVQFLYGPFAPYFNALLYRLGGVRVATLHASGGVCAVLILLLLYWLARQLMSPWEAALAAGLVLVTCAFKLNGNYIQPYAYAALYGLVFALGALTCAVRYLQCRRPLWICWAGVGAGLALVSKQELAAAALSAAGAALILGSLTARKPRGRDAALFALPALAIVAAAYGWILSRVPWRMLAEDNYVFFTNLPPQLIYFNRHVSGLNEWPKSFWYSLTGLGMCAIWAGASVLLGALASRRPAWRAAASRRALGIAVLGFAWWKILLEVFRVHTDATPVTAALFVLPAVTGVLGWRVWRARAAPERVPLAERLLLVISVFALVSLARVFLNVTTSGPYVPFFVPAVIIVYLYLLFRVSPHWLAPPGPIRARARRVAMVAVTVAIALTARASVSEFRRRNTFEVSAPRGRFLTEPELGRPLAEAIRLAAGRTAPDEYVLVLPQGTMINFLAERRNPLRQEIVHPGFLEGKNEADVVGRILARQVKLILIDNILTPEIRDPAFGLNYNQDLLRWIEERYHPVATLGPISGRAGRLGDQDFFIRAYERKP